MPMIFLVKEYIVRENEIPMYFFDMLKSIGHHQYIPATFKPTGVQSNMPQFV